MHNNAVLFGSADGWLYCLNAVDGRLDDGVLEFNLHGLLLNFSLLEPRLGLLRPAQGDQKLRMGPDAAHHTLVVRLVVERDVAAALDAARAVHGAALPVYGLT